MLPLDPKTYLKDVLRPYAVDGKAGLPDLFERYRLEPADDGDGISPRMRDVKAIWDKAVENPRYGAIAKQLAAEHGDAELALLDPSERARLGAEATERSREAERAAQRALQDWRALLSQHVAGGGVTPAARTTLERLRDKWGLDPDLVRQELDGAPVAAKPALLEDDVRKQIRTSLADLARVEGEARLALSLYHAIGLAEITDDVGRLQRRYEQAVSENQKRTYGQVATAHNTVLANVKLYLLNDPRPYLDSLVADVGEEMEYLVAQSASDRVIDATEARQLEEAALERGLTQDLARRMISELAQQHGAGLEVAAAADYVACPACNVPHDRAGSHERCKKCGAALYVTCPATGCGHRNDATALRCASCDTDLLKYAEATRRLRKLPTAVDDGRVGWAATQLEDVERILGSAAVPTAVRERIERSVTRAEATWAEVEAALAHRRLFAARAHLRALVRSAGDVLGPTGDRPAVRQAEVDRRVSEVELALGRARSADGAARETALLEAIHLASDCEEAVAALEAIPPQGPAESAVRMGSAGPIVEWTASTTVGVTYVVRRVTAHGDTVELPGTASTQVEDRAAPTGETVRYEIAAVRGRGASGFVSTGSLLVAREVQQASVVDGDGEVRLAWEAVPASARVLVRREAEGDPAEGRELHADRSGLLDCEVDNGRRYAYLIVVEYATGARTAGIRLYGQPAPPPEGITSLEIRPVTGGGVVVTFERPPVGAASILRCEADPGVSLGESLDPAALTALGETLPLAADGAHDQSSGGARWYLPVTVAGGFAVAGQAVRHLTLPKITNVAVVAAGGQFRVTWTWPDGVRIAKVVWRTDRQPSGPDDPDAQSAWFRQGEYRDFGGFTIPGAGNVFVAVVSGLRSESELIADGSIARTARAALANELRADVHYEVRRSRLRKRRLEVRVDLPVGIDAPGMVLVARPGDLLPRVAAEGEVLARLGGGAPLQQSVDLSSQKGPITVRLFLESASSAAAFQLFDPAVDDLLLK